MTLQEFLPLLNKVNKAGKGYTACCPAHDDKTPSLAVSESPEGKILLRCYTGCSALEVVQSLDLRLSDLFPDDGYFAPAGTSAREKYAAKYENHRIREAQQFVNLAINELRQNKKLSEADAIKATEYRDYLESVNMLGAMI